MDRQLAGIIAIARFQTPVVHRTKHDDSTCYARLCLFPHPETVTPLSVAECRVDICRIYHCADTNVTAEKEQKVDFGTISSQNVVKKLLR